MHRYEDHEGAVPDDVAPVRRDGPDGDVPGGPRPEANGGPEPDSGDTRAMPAAGRTARLPDAPSRLAPAVGATRAIARTPRDDATRAVPILHAVEDTGEAPVLREVGGYRLVERLGSGGMGTVYEALDADDRSVALKLIHPHVAADPAARRRLAREVSLLHKIKGESVARVLDAEVDGAEAFVVTELIQGPTLEEDVEAHGPFEPDELSGLAHGLADALAAIHGAGVVHRDLKPSNVMLSPAGPVLIDFGIAQVADDVRLTQTGMVTGTPGYLDPEVIAGAEPGTECDWWAWAAVLLFAATGRPPFGHGTMSTVLQRVASGNAQTDGAEEAVGAALRSALDPSPGRRLGHESVLDVLDGKWTTQDVAEATQFLAAAPLADDGEDDDATRTAGAPGARRGPGGGAPQRTSVLPGAAGAGAAGAGAVAGAVAGAAAGAAGAAGGASGGPATTIVPGRGGAVDPSYEPTHAPVYPPAARRGSAPDGVAAGATASGPGTGDTRHGRPDDARYGDPDDSRYGRAGDIRVAPVGAGGPGAGGPGAGAAGHGAPDDSRYGRPGDTRVAPVAGLGARTATAEPARAPQYPGNGGPAGYPNGAPAGYPSGAPAGYPGGAPAGYPGGGLVPGDPGRPAPSGSYAARASAPYTTADGPGGMVPPRHVGAPAQVAPDGSRLPVPAWLREPPHRSVTVTLLWLATAPFAAVGPGWYLVLATVLLVVLGAAGWSGRARRLTRRRMGLRRGDAARSLLRLPWDLVLSISALLLGAVLGAGVGLLTYYVVEGLTTTLPFAEHLTAGAAGAVAVATAWLTPTSYSQRLGAREVLETITPGRGARAALVGIALVVCAGVLIGVGSGAIGAPQWAPLVAPPELGSIFLPQR